MAKNKLKKFGQMKDYPHVEEPSLDIPAPIPENQVDEHGGTPPSEQTFSTYFLPKLLF